MQLDILNQPCNNKLLHFMGSLAAEQIIMQPLSLSYEYNNNMII